MTEHSPTGPRSVLYSPDFGAGWMTWNSEYAEDFLFDADLIRAIEHGDDIGDEDDPASPLGAFKARLVAKHGAAAESIYLGGADGLRVATVHGPFRVKEYDGSESILERDKADWF